MNALTSMPRVMGILNVTPDSFSDGGRYVSLDSCLDRVEQMVEEGVDIIDVGGESTRPGAAPVDAIQEIARVVPIIEAINDRFDVRISVDTSKPDVMRAAVNAGASMVNDVRALRVEGALDVVAEHGVEVCLMHMKGEPGSMQNSPAYDDVVEEVYRFLDDSVGRCLAAGIEREKIVIDPGFGFGKTLAHNLALLKALPRFKQMGLPVLVGVSRKSMFGALLGKEVEDRMVCSVAAATIAAWLGADMLRVHDVGETIDALKVCCAIKTGGPCV